MFTQSFTKVRRNLKTGNFSDTIINLLSFVFCILKRLLMAYEMSLHKRSKKCRKAVETM